MFHEKWCVGWCVVIQKDPAAMLSHVWPHRMNPFQQVLLTVEPSRSHSLWRMALLLSKSVINITLIFDFWRFTFLRVSEFHALYSMLCLFHDRSYWRHQFLSLVTMRSSIDESARPQWTPNDIHSLFHEGIYDNGSQSAFDYRSSELNRSSLLQSFTCSERGERHRYHLTSTRYVCHYC